MHDSSPTSRTYSDVLSEHKPFELLSGIVDVAKAKEAANGYETLSEAERTVLVIWDLEAEVNNGGFEQYFFNGAGNHASEAVAALERVGASHMAELTRAAIAAFGEQPPARDRFERQRQMERIADRSEDLWNDLDTKFYAYPDPVESLLVTYVRAHEREFVD